MNLQRVRSWRPSRRFYRRCAVVLALLVAAAVFGSRPAPYARPTPGPTPNLTALVAAAQRDGTANPRLNSAGHLYATTVEAIQVNWLDVAWCSLHQSCPLLQIASNGRVSSQELEQMAASQQTAAAVARTLAGAHPRYPHAELTADLGQIGGPSAGLMLTLTFLDALSGGDLSPRQAVAGTGEIAASGQVLPIGGIGQKVRGAALTGATVFLAPTSEATQARAAAPATMTVVPVATAAAALAWLCGHGATSTSCTGR